MNCYSKTMRWVLCLLLISGLILIGNSVINPNNNATAVWSNFKQFEANANRELGNGALDRIPNYDGGKLSFTDLLAELANLRSDSFPGYIGFLITSLSTFGLILTRRKSKSVPKNQVI
jgi:hypothetical protein